MGTISLQPEEWRRAIATHQARASRFTEPHLARRTRGERHPVWDFLFEYYPVRASALSRWHPGLGIMLVDAHASPHATLPFYTTHPDGTVSFSRDQFLEKRRSDMERIRALLHAVEHRPSHFDCFGLHEWAMVYRDAPRHDLPLRLEATGTNAVVEAHQIKCTHFDAYRFFTPAAKPLNLTVLERGDQVERDQAGCVHVAMDLYKWAAKMGPVVPGDLLLDAFELAVQARRLDMEASPYDCTGLGLRVVAVETPTGKAEYVSRQRALSVNAAPIRARLIALLDDLLAD